MRWPASCSSTCGRGWPPTRCRGNSSSSMTFPAPPRGRSCDGPSATPDGSAWRLLPELAAQDLAGDRLGQLVHQLHLAGVLVGGHALAAEGDQLLGGRLLSRPQADEGLDRLAPVLVGDADDRGLPNGRMLI